MDASFRIDQRITMKICSKLNPFENRLLLSEYLVYMFTK